MHTHWNGSERQDRGVAQLHEPRFAGGLDALCGRANLNRPSCSGRNQVSLRRAGDPRLNFELHPPGNRLLLTVPARVGSL
jgi:hypothetical protein